MTDFVVCSASFTRTSRRFKSCCAHGFADVLAKPSGIRRMRCVSTSGLRSDEVESGQKEGPCGVHHAEAGGGREAEGVPDTLWREAGGAEEAHHRKYRSGKSPAGGAQEPLLKNKYQHRGQQHRREEKPLA